MSPLSIYILEVMYIISIIIILVMIFVERAEPGTIVFWSIVLLCIPIVGFIVYLCFGQTFYGKRQFYIKNLNDKEIAKIQEESISQVNSAHGDDELVEERTMATALMRSGGSFYTDNNDATLYIEGEDFFRDLFQDLRNAKKFIHLEFYIIRSDALANEFMDILIEKAREGVEVRLMFDALGIKGKLKRRCAELVRAGGEYALFHRTITLILSPRKNNRNHRKLAVIDGIIGYVAGFNIGEEYMGKGAIGYWRDSGVRVEGHGAIPINLRFIMDWGYATNKHLEAKSHYFPIDAEKKYGNDILQIISGGPDSMYNPIEMQYLKIISTAKRTLYIHTPYLVPDPSTMKALQLAAHSGVDVRIIIPDRPDHPLVYWSSLWYANQLIKRGVRVFQYNRGFVHSKSIVADRKYCSVGSANLDRRSMTLNFETNAMLYSEDIGKQMEDAFQNDLSYSTEYTAEDHKNRRRIDKMKMSISRLFSAWA